MSVRWEYPVSVDELRDCVLRDVRLHGGGTGIMRNPPADGVLADLSRAGIDEMSTDARTLRIGGAATYTRVLDALGGAYEGHALYPALSSAAAPALRNRITVGGSVALFPPWSSLIGPLVALDAEVELVGAHEGRVPIDDYLARRDLGTRTAVAAVYVPLDPGWRCHWYRFARAAFNYSLFTVTVLARVDHGRRVEARIVLTGTRGRYHRCRELEERLAAARADDTLFPIRPEDLGTTIPDRQGFSGDYLTHRAAVEVARGLAAVGGAG